MRILIATSSRAEIYEKSDIAELFRQVKYSLGAIIYHLSRKPDVVIDTAGFRTTVNPKRLAAKIASFRPDIVYTHGAISALVPIYLRKHGCAWRNYKVIHGWDDVYGEIWRDVYGWLPGWLMDIMERAIVHQSDGVVTLSRYNQERGRHWGVESVYIPNGADVPAYDPARSTIRLEGRLKLVYTGDQARWKRTWELCEAMADLPKDIKLYLTGGHYAYLDKYASENCIFLGYLPKNDQLAVMSQADVLVITANQDCNAKIQEYLRFGKPILGYDGRPNLFFTNGRNALLTRDYRTAIRQLADDPALRARLAANARNELPVMTWAEIAAQFDAYFRSLLAEAGAVP